MKPKFLTFAFLVMSLTVFSQIENNAKDRSRFGLRGGLNYSNISYGGDIDFKPKIGFNIGGTYNLLSSKKFVLPIELLYNKVGSSTDYAEYDFSLVNINVLVNYFMTKNLYLEGGLVSGVYLTGKEKVKSTNLSRDILADDLMPVDVSLGIGTGYEFTNRVFANLRYSYGLLGMFINDDNSSALSNLSLNLGYTF